MSERVAIGTRGRVPSSAIKSLVFAVITLILIGLLATLIGNISFRSSRTFHAVFVDATGVNKGDRVRLAGVEVGSVKDFELHTRNGDSYALVTFTVEDGIPLYRDAKLALRYENVIGQRYLSIDETRGDKPLMPEHGTFPVNQTQPALNLTTLLDGFQPLFQALSPDELNVFSFEIIRAVQGEAGAVQELMQNVASLTNTLADRGQTINSVVDNLGQVMATVADRDDELTAFITEFRGLMRGLANRGDQISAALPSLAALLTTTNGLIQEVRPPLRNLVTSTDKLSGQLADTRDELGQSLQNLPTRLRALGRAGSYGSWFNFYLCGLGVELALADGTVALSSPTIAANERGTVCGAGGVQ